jgi:NAD(P)-dependent dehydrogenase (short-subunit alcohol dehydrogenase family)
MDHGDTTETTEESLNKVAIVTGAGTGIGKAAAFALLKEGYSVAFAGRRIEPLEKAVSESGAGARAIAVSTDVGDPKSVAALFAKAKSAFGGRLDVLFNNAGMGAPAQPMEDLPYDKWSAVVAANLTGTFLCCQEAVKIMKAQDPKGGRIINNGSISAHAPRPMSIAYTATKHAVTGITKTLSLDLRKHDIAVSQIDIGNAATEMTDRMVQGPGVMQANGTYAIEPRMNVQDVADAIVFMSRLPLESNVQFMTIMATKMPFVGRG